MSKATKTWLLYWAASMVSASLLVGYDSGWPYWAALAWLVPWTALQTGATAVLSWRVFRDDETAFLVGQEIDTYSFVNIATRAAGTAAIVLLLLWGGRAWLATIWATLFVASLACTYYALLIFNEGNAVLKFLRKTSTEEDKDDERV